MTAKNDHEFKISDKAVDNMKALVLALAEVIPEADGEGDCNGCHYLDADGDCTHVPTGCPFPNGPPKGATT